MKKQDFLNHTGLTEAEFYAKYKDAPTFFKSKSGVAFKAKYGAVLKKAQSGTPEDEDGNGIPDYLEGSPPSGFHFGPQANDFTAQTFNPINYSQTNFFKKETPFAGIDYAGKGNMAKAPLPAGIKEPLPEGIGKNSGGGLPPDKKNTDLSPYIQAAGDTGEGAGMLEGERLAAQKAHAQLGAAKATRLSYFTQDRDSQRQLAESATKLRKSKMPIQSAFSTFPSLGTGYNIQATKSGGKLPTGGYMSPLFTQMDSGGEIQNMYNTPDDIYTDGGYEPRGESGPGFTYTPPEYEEIQKAYRSGGFIPKADVGYGTNQEAERAKWINMANTAKGAMSSMSGPNAGAKIGSAVGTAVGTAFFGPVGGAVGGLVLGAASQALDPYTGRLAKDNRETTGIFDEIASNEGIKSTFSGNRRSGGYLSHDWQPQVITHFGDNSMRELLDDNDPTMRTLRSGGNLRTNQVGDVEAISGGYLERGGKNPYSDGPSSIVKGQTHEESNGEHTGVLMRYNRAESGSSEPDVEAEKGEPVLPIGKGKNKNINIVGDIVNNESTLGNNPKFANHKGKTLKRIVEGILGKTKEINEKDADNNEKLLALNPVTHYELLERNAREMNRKGYDDMYKIYDNATREIVANQDNILDVNKYFGTNPGKFSRKQLEVDKDNVIGRSGKKIPQAAFGMTTTDESTISPEDVEKLKAMAEVPAGQHQRGAYYGNVNVDSFNKLKEKNPYFDWDIFQPGRSGDTQYFQKYFNNLAQKVGSPSSLTVDDKLGEQTASAESTWGAPAATTTGTTPAETDKKEEVTPYKKLGLETAVGQVLPWLRKPPGEALQADQLYGEMYSLATNKEQPVGADFFQPQLTDPYNVSFQDKLNENQSTFNSMLTAYGNNPSVATALAAQKYGADSGVLADQFRTNQEKQNRTYEENRNLLNQARQFNINIADQQRVRQATAASATRREKQDVFNSISSKIGENRLENRTIQTLANKFPDYSFDKNYRIRHTGMPVAWNIDQGIYNEDEEGTPISEVPVYDDKGNLLHYRRVPLPPGSKEEEEKKKKAKGKVARHGDLIKAFKNL